MARTIRNAKLDTPSARTKLPQRREPYWIVLNRGQALGYRKGSKGGTWIAKLRMRDGQHRTGALGSSDDANEGEAAGALSYATAQERAREWFTTQLRGEATTGPLTVADAMRDYLDWYKTHRKALREVTYRSDKLILPALGTLQVATLTAARLRKWHQELAARPPMLRTKPGATQRYRDASDDPDALRKRQATANKVLTILKAALNHAWHEGKVASDDAWRRVKPFANVDAPRIRYLTLADCQRLANACEPDFRKLVQAAMLTGCRYGELTALRCEDYNSDTRLLHIRTSKSGKPRDVPVNDEGAAFFKAQITGRAGTARMFLRDDGEAWGKSHQNRRLAEAAKRVSLADVSFHILRHVYGATLAREGVSMRVIADVLGHADTRITEKHYAHLAPSHVADTIRQRMPRIGIEPSANIRTLRAATS